MGSYVEKVQSFFNGSYDMDDNNLRFTKHPAHVIDNMIDNRTQKKMSLSKDIIYCSVVREFKTVGLSSGS